MRRLKDNGCVMMMTSLPKHDIMSWIKSGGEGCTCNHGNRPGHSKELRVDVNVLKWQNLCSTLKIHIWCNGQNPKTWAFSESVVKTVWWICKTLKRIPSSFSQSFNLSCWMNHIRRSSHRNITFPVDNTKVILFSTSQNPLPNSERDPQEKLGILAIWEDPWTYVKALAARMPCGFFLMQISRRCEGRCPLRDTTKLVCGKRKGSLFAQHQKGWEKTKVQSVDMCVQAWTEGLWFGVRLKPPYDVILTKNLYICCNDVISISWRHHQDGLIRGGSIFLVDITSVCIDNRSSRVSRCQLLLYVRGLELQEKA